MNPLYTSFAGAHQEFGTAYSENRRRRPHLHGVGGLLRDLARDHRESSARERGVEDTFVRSGVERVALDLQHAVRPYGQERIVDESDPGGAVRSGDHDIGSLQMRSDVGRKALAASLEIYRALGHLE